MENGEAIKIMSENYPYSFMIFIISVISIFDFTLQG